MTYNPATLQQLGAFWTAQGGVNLGVVGNAAHTKGYHLGKDRIFAATGDGWKDYSVRLERDREGLSNAASAIDLGRLDGTLANLRAFSRWLVAEATEDRAKYRDIREVIYTPDGRNVVRWSGEDGKIHTGPGNGDDSHLTHTHISFYRDSERRDKRPLFAGYFISPPDTGTGDEMIDLYAVPGRFQAQFKTGSRSYQQPGAPAGGTLDPAKWYDLVAQDAATAGWYLLDGGVGRMAWAKVSDIARKRDLTEYLSAPSTASVEVNLGGKRYIGNVTST